MVPQAVGLFSLYEGRFSGGWDGGIWQIHHGRAGAWAASRGVPEDSEQKLTMSDSWIPGQRGRGPPSAQPLGGDDRGVWSAWRRRHSKTEEGNGTAGFWITRAKDPIDMGQAQR